MGQLGTLSRLIHQNRPYIMMVETNYHVRYEKLQTSEDVRSRQVDSWQLESCTAYAQRSCTHAVPKRQTRCGPGNIAEKWLGNYNSALFWSEQPPNDIEQGRSCLESPAFLSLTAMSRYVSFSVDQTTYTEQLNYIIGRRSSAWSLQRRLPSVWIRQQPSKPKPIRYRDQAKLPDHFVGSIQPGSLPATSY